MSEKVVFSQLSRKFIDENDATPAEAQQVVYYSLAIGHHLGVIDCLEAALTCRGSDYLAWIATLERAAKPAVKWKACRNMVRSSSTLTMCRCWPTHSIKPGQRKLRSQKEWSTMLLSMLHDIHQETPSI